MSRSFGKVAKDLEVQNFKTQSLSTTCKGDIKANTITACQVNATRLNVSEPLPIPSQTVGLSRLSYFPEPETFQFISDAGNLIASTQWNIQQFWIQENDRAAPFVPLLAAPVSSNIVPSISATACPPPFSNGTFGCVTQFLDFLNQFFLDQGLTAAYGFQALPATGFDGSVSNSAFAIRSSISKLTNFVFILGRSQNQGAFFNYGYALDMGYPFRNLNGFVQPYNGLSGWVPGISAYAGQDQPQEALTGALINLGYHNPYPQIFMTSENPDPFTFETLEP